jgi:hypothetical protein
VNYWQFGMSSWKYTPKCQYLMQPVTPDVGVLQAQQCALFEETARQRIYNKGLPSWRSTSA